MSIAAASAAVASFSGLRGLAEATGWPARLAWLLPVTIDAYAMTSARVWLAASTGSRPARRFARANALGAIAVSITGNAAYHAVGAGLLAVSWPIVVAVGAVPATVLGLTAHLHALRYRNEQDPAVPKGPATTPTGPGTERPTQTDPDIDPGTDTDPTPGRPGQSRSAGRTGSATAGRTGSRGKSRSRNRSEADLVAAAHAADAAYRAHHGGRPIPRDELRAALRISAPRASELRRTLTAGPEQQAAPARPSPDVPTTPDVPDRKEATEHP